MKPIVDVSKYQSPDNIDYDAMADEVSGVIIRCSYGSVYDSPYGKEPYFEIHYNEFTNRGIPVGVYFFLTEYQPVVNQVRTFIEKINQFKARQYPINLERIFGPAYAGQTVMSLNGFPLGYWLDVEVESNAPKLKKQTVHDFIQQAEAQLGTSLGIYTSKIMWNDIMNGAYYTNKWLWFAFYGNRSDIPKWIPTGWTRYFIWQYLGDKGRIPGYSGGIDLNEFNGNAIEYMRWLLEGDEYDPPVPAPPLTALYRPCDKWAYITQNFGENPSWYPISRGHNGLDFGFNYTVGHPIYAAADGTVEVSRDDTTGYGRHIRIRHSHGITIYGHLSRRDVFVGNIVKAKQLIGLSGGATDDPYAGFSTGPHLHFEYRWDIPAPQVPGGYVYNAVDPLPLIIEHDEEGEEMLYQVKVIAYALNIRAGIGTGYKVLYAVERGTILDVFEESNGWLRVGVGAWCSGNPSYVEKINVAPPIEPPVDPTMEEKVNALWEYHPELH